MAYERSGNARAEGIAFRLVSSAFENMLTGTWEWDEIPGIAIVKAADKLSHFREELNLVLDAIGLGYWIRRAEVDLTDGVNMFDTDHVEHLREKFEEADEPDQIITVSMNQVREALPEPFTQGSDAWKEVLDIALPNLQERARTSSLRNGRIRRERGDI